MRRAVFCMFAASISAPALAKEKAPTFVEFSAVKDKPNAALDRTKAYIMVRADDALATYLMKMPTPEDQAAYDKLRADAFKQAHDKYLKKRASYEAAVKAHANVPKGAPGSSLPDKPIEPTIVNFEFTPFGVLAAVPIGPVNRFAKTGTSTYVEEVTPGDYRVYGPIFAGPQGGLTGKCFCMGSGAFTARAGEIADLGFVATKAAPKFRAADGDSSAPVPVADTPYLAPPPASSTSDPRLAALPIVPVRFRAVGKLPNYFGVTITRIPAMPGIIAYDRDHVIDLATN